MGEGNKQKLALVFGTLPTTDEIDQFQLIAENFDITVISTESICGYLNETSRYNNLRCLALPDHDENPTYIPGLEQILGEFDTVVVKERLGLYAYQTVKAKWKCKYRLVVWADNLATLPAEDVDRMRTIRTEVTNAADAFIVQSKAAKDALLLEGIEEARIHEFSPWVQKYGERTKKTRSDALEALQIPESAITIAYLGQIEWEEGLLELAAGIKMAAIINPEIDRRIRLIICGIGSFSLQLRETLVSLNVDDKTTIVAPSRDAFKNVWAAADGFYIGSTPARDRIEGDPYRILAAMTNEVPIIAPRSPLVEEMCGKHRLDFCFASPSSVAAAIGKFIDAASLKNNVVKKNTATVKSRFSKAVVGEQMKNLFVQIGQRLPTADKSPLDHKVVDVEALVNSKQYLKAIDVIESIFKTPDVPVHHEANLYRLIGDCFAKMSDNEGAKNAYTRAVELDPYSTKAYIGLGTVALVKQSNDIAVFNFQKAVSMAPNDEMANLGLGLAFQGMEELAEASKWVLKSLEINPENTAALYSQVRIAYVMEKYDDTERVLRTYVDKHPHDVNMLYTLGGIQFQQGKYEEVLELTKSITAIDPMDEKAHALYQQAQRAMKGEETQASTSEG